MAWRLLLRPAMGFGIALARQEIRCLRASYTALATAVAIAVLTVRSSGVARHLAVAMLAPLALRAFWVAAATVATTMRAWRESKLGASVSQALAALGSAYRTTSRVAAGPGREEHVAVGPNGVFVILACDDGGQVTASDQRLFGIDARKPWRNLVEDCRVEALRVAERVRRRLGRPVPVHGILCFARALVAVGQEVRGVKIVQVPRLAPLVASAPTGDPLSDTEVEAALAAVAAPEPEHTIVRPVFQLTRRERMVPHAERLLTLVRCQSSPQPGV